MEDGAVQFTWTFFSCMLLFMKLSHRVMEIRIVMSFHGKWWNGSISMETHGSGFMSARISNYKCLLQDVHIFRFP